MNEVSDATVQEFQYTIRQHTVPFGDGHEAILSIDEHTGDITLQVSGRVPSRDVLVARFHHLANFGKWRGGERDVEVSIRYNPANVETLTAHGTRSNRIVG